MQELETQFLAAAQAHQSGDRPRARALFRALLDRWPACHEAHYMLALTCAELGDLAAAEAGFKRALELDPESPEYLYRLGQLYLHQRKGDDAADTLARARDLGEESADVLHDYASACMLCRRFEEARASWARVIELDPSFGEARSGLVSALGAMSRFDEAVEQARVFVAQQPTNPDAHARLALLLERVNNLPEAEQAAAAALRLDPASGPALHVRGNIHMRAGRLEEARADLEAALNADLSPNDRRDVCRVLGLVLDRLGRYDEAFARFAQSKRRLEEMPRSVVDTADQFMRFLDACRRELTASAVAAWSPAPPYPAGREAPVFFVGFPRSGTTLLEQMLAAHGRFATTDEHPSLSRVRDAIIRRAGALERVPGALSSLSLRDIEELREIYWADVEQALGAAALKGKRILDKHPLNTANMGIVRRIFPDARVMMSFRDPRDVVLSCFMNLTRTVTAAKVFRTLDDASAFYARSIDLWFHYRAALGLGFIEVKYEDVVQDAERECRRVLEFFGEPWNPDLLRFTEKTERKTVRSTSYQQVTEGLYARAIGRWMNYRAHFGDADRTLAPFVAALGYPPTPPR